MKSTQSIVFDFKPKINTLKKGSRLYCLLKNEEFAYRLLIEQNNVGRNY